MSKEIKDFCGLINEEVLRKNFILIYELLDEIFDFGYPQLTSTEQIKPFIVNEPIQIVQDNIMQNIKPKFSKFNIFTPNTINSTAVQRSVKDKSGKNEIFVDVFEKLQVLFNSSGYIINQSIEGCVRGSVSAWADPDEVVPAGQPAAEAGAERGPDGGAAVDELRRSGAGKEWGE